MFPGYATYFKDDEKYVHLYFYPGIDDNGDLFYKELDLSKCGIQYDEIKHKDSSKEFILKNKNIVKIICNLIDINNVKRTKVLNLK